MGFVMVHSECFGCRRRFAYNPHRVPSLTINGTREPICRDCIERVNPLRQRFGLEPLYILPGAYDPIPEEEL